MTASKRWALVIGLVLLVLGLGGGTAWLRRSGDMAGAPGAPVGFAGAPTSGGTAAPAADAPKTAALRPADAPAPAPASAPPAEAPPPAPRFDIVRVEPSGDTVVAGKGEPNAKVALLAHGVVVAETSADANGHFVVLPKALEPGDHSLSLRQTTPKGATSTSAQSVTVVVPERGKGSVVVALAEPGQATKVLSAPDAPADSGPVPPAAPNPASVAAQGPKGDPDAKVAVRAVDLEHGDGFHASGAAAPGTPVTIYLNNAHIADVIAGADGQWTVTIKKGLAGGHYVVRADAGPAPKAQANKTQESKVQDGKTQETKTQETKAQDTKAPGKPQVTARAEVPFDVPVTSVTPPDARRPGRADVAVASRPDASQAAAGASNAGNAVIEEIQTARVVDGDNLWNISLSRLGQATRYTQIYAANEKQIRDPNLIYPGQVFVLPR